MRFIDLSGIFRPRFLGAAASIMGILGGANSLFGGGSQYSSNQGSGAPQYYIPTGMGGADSAWQQILGNLQQNTESTNSLANPLFLQAFMDQMGIDPARLSDAGFMAGQQYYDMGNQNLGYSSQLQGQAQGDMQRQQMLTQAGFDPQNAMYNRERQQTVDASRAADSARGLAMSPYSSGNESTALNNFNTNWDYNTLQRMATANQGANQTGALVGADLSGASQFAGQVPQNYINAGAAPIAGQEAWANFRPQFAQQLQANMGGGNAAMEQLLQQIIPYMNQGQGATNSAFNAFSNQQQNAQNNSSSGMEALLTGLKGAGTSYNTPGSWLNNTFGGGSQYPSSTSGISPYMVGGDFGY